MSDDLIVPNGGAATILAQALGEVKSQLVTVVARQDKHQETLTEIKTLQTQWATKLEVSESIAALRESLLPIAAQASAAHQRTDEIASSVDALSDKLDTVVNEIAHAKGGGIALSRAATLALGLLAATASFSGWVAFLAR